MDCPAANAHASELQQTASSLCLSSFLSFDDSTRRPSFVNRITVLEAALTTIIFVLGPIAIPFGESNDFEPKTIKILPFESMQYTLFEFVSVK